MDSMSMQVRASILGENEDIFELHKDLVSTKLMGDEEFWRIRGDLIEFQSSRLKQLNIDNCYYLSEEMKQQIFQQHPAVKKVYETHGKKMEEKEFWSEYFSSVTYGDGSKVSLLLDGKKSARISDSFETDNTSDANYILSAIVDIRRTVEDHDGNFGNKEADYLEEPRLVGTSELLLEINKQSAIKVDKSKITTTTNDPEEDLIFDEPAAAKEGPQRQPIPEGIRPKLYFEDNLSEAESVSVDLEPIETFSLNQKTEEPSERKFEFHHIDYNQVKRIHASLIEVLRHFWSVMPPDTVEKRKTASSMIKILDQLLANYESWLGTLHTVDLIQVQNLIKPTLDTVSRAQKVHKDFNK